MEDVMVVFFIIAVWIFFVVSMIGLAGGFDPQAYCPVGQATILDDRSNVTGCVILPPVAPPGYVLAPGTPAPAPVAIVPPLYK